MRLFSNYLFATLMISIFLLASRDDILAQKKEASSVEADMAKMSKEAQADLEKVAAAICQCVDQHEKEASTFLNKALPLLKDAQEKENISPLAVVIEVMSTFEQIKPFQQCVLSANEIANTALLQKEVEKIIGEAADEQVIRLKEVDFIQILVDKTCSNEQDIFRKYIAYDKIMFTFQTAEPETDLSKYEDNRPIEDFIAELSAEALADLDKIALGGCQCLNQYNKEVSAYTEKVNSIFQEDLAKWEILSKLSDAMDLIKDYNVCFLVKITEVNSEQINKELDQVMGKYIHPMVKERKKRELTNFTLGKHCPDKQQMFQKYVEANSKMEAILAE